ncbi:MAG: helix-turn-helix domain-containing protein [Ruminococcus sp.]|nr:helix-turn-helix domain-containing protein [Ruminococcus sp.]
MENNALVTIGQRMAEIRRHHNTTQEALADMLDVSPKHISHCENATSFLSLKNLIKFCNIFDCSLDYLVFGNQNDSILSKLPNEIITILQTGTDTDLNRLTRYLQIYIELQSLPNSRS